MASPMELSASGSESTSQQAAGNWGGETRNYGLTSKTLWPIVAGVFGVALIVYLFTRKGR